MVRMPKVGPAGVVVYIVTKAEHSGALRAYLALVKKVAERGIKTIFITGPDGSLAGQAGAFANEVYCIPSLRQNTGLWGLGREIVAFCHVTYLLWSLKRQHAELIVHTHSTEVEAGIVGRWAAWFAGVPHRVHTVHAFAFHAYQRIIDWWLAYVLEYVTAWITTTYVCESEVDRQTGLALLPYFSQRGCLIRPAVDSQLYSAAKIAPARLAQRRLRAEPIRLGTISSFSPQENLWHLLFAVRRLVVEHALSVELEIIGDGMQAGNLFAWVVSNGLQNVIKFRGWSPDAVAIMRQWDLFVLSSLWEGLPCTVVEARLLHLPVVAYGVGGIAEVITSGHNGLLVEPGNLEMFYQALYSVVVDGALRKQLAYATQDLARFNDGVMVKQYTELYQQLHR